MKKKPKYSINQRVTIEGHKATIHRIFAVYKIENKYAYQLSDIPKGLIWERFLQDAEPESICGSCENPCHKVPYVE